MAGIARRGELAWFGTAGTIDGTTPSLETQYRIGSISKTFVAVEVMRLRDEGLLRLSDPIGRHIAELERFSFTIGHLLSHTSGLRAETSGPWWERTKGVPFAELAESSLGDDALLCRPGRRFHYSNLGYGVLGEVIARLRRRPSADVVADELLDPAGMPRTTTRPAHPASSGFGVHPHADVAIAEPEHDAGAMAPAGQWWSTVKDLASWSAVLAGLRPEILSADSASEMREPIALEDVPGEPWTAAYGLGIDVMNLEGRRIYGHGGSMPGFLALLRIDAETADTVIVMTNATSGLERELETDLRRIFLEHEPLGLPPFTLARGSVAEDVIELTGTWYWGTNAYLLSVTRDGGLELSVLAPGRGREAAFRPLGDGTYVGLSGYYHGEVLRPVRLGDGRLSHLDIGSFVFTRTPYDPLADVPGGVDEGGWSGDPVRAAEQIEEV